MGFSLSTFAIELVNFLVLLYLLRRLVYQPLQQGIRQRRSELAATRAELEQQRSELSEEREAQRRQREELSGLRQSAIEEAGQQAEEERNRILAQARETATAELQRAQRLVDSERESTRAWLREEAVELSSELAGRLLLSLDAKAADTAFFEALLLALGEAAPVTEAPPITVEVTCAQMPVEQNIERLRSAAERLAPGARFRLEADPSLGAGCVVRVGSSVFDASLSGRLRLLRERARRLLPESGGTEEVRHGGP